MSYLFSEATRSSVRQRPHVGRFRRAAVPGMRSLTPTEAVQWADTLRSLSHIAVDVLRGAITPPPDAPPLVGPMQYYRYALRTELELTLAADVEAHLAAATRAYARWLRPSSPAPRAS